MNVPVTHDDNGTLTERQVISGSLFSSPATQQVCKALALAQAAFDPPKRTKTANVKMTNGGSYQFAYAPLEEIISSVKDGLAKASLCRQQYLVRTDRGYVIRTILWHESGEWLGGDYPIHVAGDGPQKFASGVTYARRQGLCLMLGLAPEDDDDGNAAEGNKASITSKPAAKPPTKPAQPAPSPMTEEVDPFTGEVKEVPKDHPAIRELDASDWDQRLGDAAEAGEEALKREWKSVPQVLKSTLKAALDRRHKPRAQLVDAEAHEETAP